MKKFRQLAALFLAFAMVIGVFSTPKVAYAAATSLTEDKVTINYDNERLEVTASDTVYYATKWTTTSHATTNWEESYKVDGTKQTIDFSNTSASKDAYFFITDDTEKEPIKITVKAQETTLAVAFSGTAETTAKSKIKVANDWTDVTDVMTAYVSTPQNPWAYGYLNVTVGKGTAAKAMTATEASTYLQFRKGTTGTWKSITELDVRKYAASGAQLYFRIKPSSATVTSGGAITTLGRASKEVKVTYTKQANAPKVSVTGDTKEIRLSKTQEYRTFTTSGGNRTYTSWVKVADEHMTGTKVDKVYLKDLVEATSGSAWSYDENVAGQGVQVRTAATDKAVASKVGTVVLNQATSPTVSSSSGIKFELLKSTTYDKGIKVTNVSGPAIQVAVVSGSPINVNDTKVVKWLTVAPGKYTTLAGTVLAKGDRILYRAATIKDNTKTSANEFVVSSKYSSYDFKDQLPLATQKFEISTTTTVTATVSTVSPSAVVTGSGPYTVTVTNTASPSAITVVLDVTTENVVKGTPVVACVNAANDSGTAATATKVKLLANGAFTETAGKLKITIAADATAETKIFRVTLDGKKTYVTVDFKTN